MPVATDDYIAAIAHLPLGGVLRIDDVPWKEYEQLLADLGEGYSARIFYDRGRMEVVAPDSIHEKYKGITRRLIDALSDELDIDIESFGSTTFRLEKKLKGAEPDECFYVQNARLIIGKRGRLNLSEDPPPDIFLEVDHTSRLLDKFPIYAALCVPEIWRIKAGVTEIHLLVGDRYEESPNSLAFPFLTSADLSRFIEQGLAEGESKASRAFRAWLRERASTPKK